MNAKRIAALSLGFLMNSALLYADATYVTVELKSSEKYSFKLNEKPVITFENGDLVVNGDALTSYAISGVKNFHFNESDETGTEVLDENTIGICRVDENTIMVQRAAQSAVVSLISAKGVVLSSQTSDVAGNAIVSLPSAKGVYILNVGNKSFKVIRK